MAVAVRTTLSPNESARVLRAAVRDLDKTLPVFDIAPMQDRVGRSLGARRLAMSVLAGFAGLSLLLAALGIYGVLSFGVSQRWHEIGIRLALGANPARVVRLVVRGGLTLIVAGLGIGITVFLVLVRVMAPLVYGLSTHDRSPWRSGCRCWWPWHWPPAISPPAARRQSPGRSAAERMIQGITRVHGPHHTVRATHSRTIRYSGPAPFFCRRHRARRGHRLMRRTVRPSVAVLRFGHDVTPVR